jgi:hypothetical protein
MAMAQKEDIEDFDPCAGWRALGDVESLNGLSRFVKWVFEI